MAGVRAVKSISFSTITALRNGKQVCCRNKKLPGKSCRDSGCSYCLCITCRLHYRNLAELCNVADDEVCWVKWHGMLLAIKRTDSRRASWLWSTGGADGTKTWAGAQTDVSLSSTKYSRLLETSWACLSSSFWSSMYLLSLPWCSCETTLTFQTDFHAKTLTASSTPSWPCGSLQLPTAGSQCSIALCACNG